MNKMIRSIALFAALTFASAAALAVPGYEGSSFAWDYATGVANHTGFKLTVNGVTGSTTFGKDVRQVKLSDTVLSGKPFATYTLRLVATAAPPAVDSLPATLVVEYQARPQLIAPTGLKIIFEWAP